VVEGARLESEYTAKPYRGFESLPLRHISIFTNSPAFAEDTVSLAFTAARCALMTVDIRSDPPECVG
jgi:hypothetical protein